MTYSLPYPIRQVAVIGAGTMGAAIAAHVANAGLPVLLLDIAPDRLTPQEEAQGLTLASPAVRNRLVQAGFDRTRQVTPPSFINPDAERRVTLGNIEDDLPRIAEADWIVEAIIEKLEPKQQLLARIEAVRRPDSIVTTNTSGLPIALLAEGRSQEFKRHFLCTHFFNPPRYLKLLELIPIAETDAAVVETMTQFGRTRLDKGIVLGKDTPNFIGNRLFSIGNSFAANYALEHGYTISEVDELTGPLLGRPKTGTFRLQDLVGLDIINHIAHNLYDLIPHDPYREVLHAPKLKALVNTLMANGWLGNKTGQGFYKTGTDAAGKRVFMTLNPTTLDYDLPERTCFEAVDAVRNIEDLGERVRAVLNEQWSEDRGTHFVWAVLSYELAYAAAVAPDIAHDLKSIDEAIRWGFAFEAGPFQLWDHLGVAETVAKIEASGLTVAAWVKAMLAAGCPTFYRVDDGRVTGYYDWVSQTYTD